MEKVRYIKTDVALNGYGLGGSTQFYVAVRGENEFLVLVGADQPYQPLGGRKLLKEIVEDPACVVGECYVWKPMKMIKN